MQTEEVVPSVQYLRLESPVADSILNSRHPLNHSLHIQCPLPCGLVSHGQVTVKQEPTGRDGGRENELRVNENDDEERDHELDEHSRDSSIPWYVIGKSLFSNI